MNYMIAIVKNSKSGKSYRIIETDSGKFQDMTVQEIIDSGINVENIKVSPDGNVEATVGNLFNYPKISVIGIVNRIVILFKIDNQNYKITDGTGRLREATFEMLSTCDEKKVANLECFPELKGETPKNFGNSFRDKIYKILGNKNLEPIGQLNEEQTDKFNSLNTFNPIKLSKTDTPPWEDPCDSSDLCENNSLETSNQETTDTNLNTDQDLETNTETDTEADTEAEDFGTYTLKIEDTDDGRRVVSGINPTRYRGDVVIPEGVTHIDDEAFRHCYARSYEIPETVVYLGEYAFAETRVKNITLPKSIIAISHYCFWHSNIKSINLEHIKSIGNYAFTNTELETVDLNGEVIQIGLYSFADCQNLQEFKHNEHLKKIRSNAFSNCPLLQEFDLENIEDIEGGAFDGTALHKVKINGAVQYIKPYTIISPNITEVELGDGVYKIADFAIMNKDGKPITYTIPKSVTNIGIRVFNKEDTVRLYHGSIAESSARLAECNIEYIDDTVGQRSKTILKAQMLNLDIPEMISKMITDLYSKDDVDYDYDIDETSLINIPLNDELLDMLGIQSVIAPNGYEEKSKFKVLLEHYSKCCKMNPVGFTSNLLNIKDTFSVQNKAIYDDGISRIYEFTYIDNKYQSKWAKYIVAMTGNTVRYCCLPNRYTDIYCKTAYSKDLKKLLDVLVEGDTIGYNCTIAGKAYNNISSKADLKNKNGEKLSLNIFQALFNCSIVIKLEHNRLALILPVNGKILKCSSLGKAVWANENDESYKTKYCVIESIQDIKGNTIIEYGVNSPNRDDRFFKEMLKLSTREQEDRLNAYSKIGVSNVSAYTNLRNHCTVNHVENVEELDLYGLGYLMGLPIIEERTSDWIDKSVNKTVVPAAHYEFLLKDGTRVYQYKTVKRVAMRNKLIVGGDSTVYIFDIYNFAGDRLKVFASTLDIETLLKQALSINDILGKKASRVYEDKYHLDVVSGSDMIFIATANSVAKGEGVRQDLPVWLAVYKPNGLYYLTYYDKLRHHGYAVLLVQVGSLDILMDYFDNSDMSISDRFYNLMTIGEYEFYLRNHSGFCRKECIPYEEFLRARALVIDGVQDYSKYKYIKMNTAIKYMFGVNLDKTLYDLPEAKDDSDEIDFGSLHDTENKTESNPELESMMLRQLMEDGTQ